MNRLVIIIGVLVAGFTSAVAQTNQQRADTLAERFTIQLLSKPETYKHVSFSKIDTVWNWNSEINAFNDYVTKHKSKSAEAAFKKWVGIHHDEKFFTKQREREFQQVLRSYGIKVPPFEGFLITHKFTAIPHAGSMNGQNTYVVFNPAYSKDPQIDRLTTLNGEYTPYWEER